MQLLKQTKEERSERTESVMLVVCADDVTISKRRMNGLTAYWGVSGLGRGQSPYAVWRDGCLLSGWSPSPRLPADGTETMGCN